MSCSNKRKETLVSIRILATQHYLVNYGYVECNNAALVPVRLRVENGRGRRGFQTTYLTTTCVTYAKNAANNMLKYISTRESLANLNINIKSNENEFISDIIFIPLSSGMKWSSSNIGIHVWYDIFLIMVSLYDSMRLLFTTIQSRSHDIYQRDHSVCQWKKTLHDNVVSHWLGPYTTWSLHYPLSYPQTHSARVSIYSKPH